MVSIVKTGLLIRASYQDKASAGARKQAKNFKKASEVQEKAAESLTEQLAETGGMLAGVGDVAKDTSKSLRNSIPSWGKTALAVAGLGAAGARMIVSLAAAADEIAKAAQIAGTSVEEYSRLKFAVEQTGGDMGKLKDAMSELTKKVVEGNPVVAKYGLTLRDSNGEIKSQSELLSDAVGVINEFSTSTERAAAATILFGGAGRELLPFLELGASGIAELSDEADRLGITLSQKSALAASELTDSVGKLSSTASGFGQELVRFFGPVLVQISDVSSELIAIGSVGVGALSDLDDAISDFFSDIAAGSLGYSDFVNTTNDHAEAALFAARSADDLTDSIKDQSAAIEELSRKQIGELLAGLAEEDRERDRLARSTERRRAKRQQVRERDAKETAAVFNAEIKEAQAVAREMERLASEDRRRMQSIADLEQSILDKRDANISAFLARRAADADKRLAMQESVQIATLANIEQERQARNALAASVVGTLQPALDSLLDSEKSLAEAGKQIFANLARQAIQSAATFAVTEALKTKVKQAEGAKRLGVSAAEAGGDAVAAHAGIPFAGIAIGLAAAAALIAAIKGFSTLFQGFESGGTVPGRDIGRDSVLAMLRPGEEVLNTRQARVFRGAGFSGEDTPGEFGRRAVAIGGGGTAVIVNQTIKTILPPDRAKLASSVRVVGRELQRLRRRGQL